MASRDRDAVTEEASVAEVAAAAAEPVESCGSGGTSAEGAAAVTPGVGVTGSETASDFRLRFNTVPIYVADYHSDVLSFLFKCFASKRLPSANCTFVHLGAHPDLSSPMTMLADSAWDNSQLISHMSVENWILALAYTGRFSSIVWVKPPWACQIREGTFTFLVGRHTPSGHIMVNCAEPYFMRRMVWAPAEELENVREVTLDVITIGAWLEDPGASTEDEKLALEEILRKRAPAHGGLILDVDLDFFSTRNPYKDMLPDIRFYSRIASIYRFHDPSPLASTEELQASMQSRGEQLSELENLFSYLKNHGSFQTYYGPKTSRFHEVRLLLAAVLASYPNDMRDVEWDAAHSAGRTSHEGGLGLPHHLTTRTDLLRLIKGIINIVQRAMPIPPVAITVGRSSEDDYCPHEDTDFIEDEFLVQTRRCFPNTVLVMAYEGETFVETKPEPEKETGEETKPEPEKEEDEETMPESEKEEDEETKPEPEKEEDEETKPESEKEEDEETKPEPEKEEGEEMKPEPEKEDDEEVDFLLAEEEDEHSDVVEEDEINEEEYTAEEFAEEECVSDEIVDEEIEEEEVGEEDTTYDGNELEERFNRGKFQRRRY